MSTQHQWLLHNCITNLTKSFSRRNLKMASVRPKHFVSNFFMSWFLIITSIRKLLVVLLTASPDRHLRETRSRRQTFPNVTLSNTKALHGLAWEWIQVYAENPATSRLRCCTGCIWSGIVISKRNLTLKSPVITSCTITVYTQSSTSSPQNV